MTEREATQATREHIQNVQHKLLRFAQLLTSRAIEHDNSKFADPEFETFRVYTEKLKGCTYGSEEYKQFLAEMKPALDHHYAENSHHPEHSPDGIAGMDLLDLVEMFFDWWAASERHADGSIRRSIDQNVNRFGLTPQLCRIFHNTVDGWGEGQ